jgi:O-succinylhomoserine sulfhydrylase
MSHDNASTGTRLHRETLAVRQAVERSQYGENSEALYLSTGFVQPSAEASVRRFAGAEDGYPMAVPATPRSPASNSAWRRWKAPRPAWPRPRAWRP